MTSAASVSNKGVDALIDSGASLREIRPHFQTHDQVLDYYVTRQRTQYPPHRAAGAERCITCDKAPTAVAEYRWRAILFDGIRFGGLEAFMLLLGHVGLAVENRAIDFETYHPICHACWRKWRWRKRAAPVVHFFAFGGLLIGLALAPIGFLVPLYDKAIKRDGWLVSILVGVAGTLMIVLYPLLMRAVHQMQVPPPLRGIRRKPFEYFRSAIVHGDA